MLITPLAWPMQYLPTHGIERASSRRCTRTIQEDRLLCTRKHGWQTPIAVILNKRRSQADDRNEVEAELLGRASLTQIGQNLNWSNVRGPRNGKRTPTTSLRPVPTAIEALLHGLVALPAIPTQDKNNITPPATPKPNASSARSSAGDQTVVQEQPSSRYTTKRVNTDSPNTSSAEESHSRRSREQDTFRSARSRRSSRVRGEVDDQPKTTRARSQRRERQPKDDSHRDYFSSDERSRHGTKTPVSARASMSMEGLLENAFAANKSKHSKESNARSRHGLTLGFSGT